MVSRIEALADAIAYYHKSHEPDSKAYGLRNPGLLKAYSLKYPRDEAGNRQFLSVLDGYQALLFDLKLKCEGKSKRPVRADGNLAELLKEGYGYSFAEAKYIAGRLGKSILRGQEQILLTPLSYFLEN